MPPPQRRTKLVSPHTLKIVSGGSLQVQETATCQIPHLDGTSPSARYNAGLPLSGAGCAGVGHTDLPFQTVDASRKRQFGTSSLHAPISVPAPALPDACGIAKQAQTAF